VSDTIIKKKVTPIGSCRITQPLRIAQSEFGLALNKSGVYGYCHSSAEAVQMARVLLEGKPIPNDLWPLVSKGDANKNRHENSDAYVVELSSAKSITIDGQPIQLNYLSNRYPEIFSDQALGRAFWSLVDSEDQDLIRSFLEERHCPDVDLLSRIRRRFTSKDELRSDMGELMTLLPNVVFVTHIDALQASGEPIPSRSDFVADVKAVAQDLDAKLYDPTQAMRFVGQDNAIAAGDHGLAHYDERFEHLVAHDLTEMLSGQTPTVEERTNGDKDPAAMLFDIAAIRRSDPSKTTELLAQNLEKAPRLFAPAMLEHAQANDVPEQVLQLLEPHLSVSDQFQIWASHSIGDLGKTTTLSDRQIAEIINKLRAPERTEKLDALLLQIGRPISPLLSKTLAGFLKYDFASRDDLLEAAKVILKHAPSHPEARGALHHIKTWLSAQNYSSATPVELESWADLNAKLPAPNISIDLKIARQHFASGAPAAAIDVGLKAQELAPDNLTLAIMLMRAADQLNDPRRKEFANRVKSLTEDGSKYQTEAYRILERQSVQA